MNSCRTLIVVPTEAELRVLLARFRGFDVRDDMDVKLCGFGPIAAAARTHQMIAQVHPEHVVLAGIAGAYDETLPLATAYCFSEVACYGVGIGSGEQFVTASEAGWGQLGETPQSSDTLELATVIADRDAGQLLTCCAAAGNDHDLRNRMRKFPDAVAEDMEGFGVAYACRLERIPLTVVRGLSNRVGERDHAKWQTREALESAAELVLDVVACLKNPPTARS